MQKTWWIMKKNLCQGCTSFFMVLSLLPWKVSEMWSNLYNFALKESRPGNSNKNRAPPNTNKAPNTNKGNKKTSQTIDFYYLGCQVLKTTRNCIEADVFSRHLKQINTRNIRTYPNKKEWSKNTHVWTHHTKNFGNTDVTSTSVYNT